MRIIKITCYWSINAILRNLAADPKSDPNTGNGGCSLCQGALKIEGENATPILAWHTMAHASKIVKTRLSSYRIFQYG